MVQIVTFEQNDLDEISIMIDDKYVISLFSFHSTITGIKEHALELATHPAIIIDEYYSENCLLHPLNPDSSPLSSFIPRECPYYV